jgi:hypothetical protein
MRSAVEHCVRVTREIRDARREDPEPEGGQVTRTDQ